jgi:hypothetical protein
MFFALSLIVLLATPNLGTRLFYVVMTALTGVWLIRCWRSAVVLSDDGVLLRGQFRTSRYSWDHVEGATTGRMRTASPLAGRFPYVNLVLRLQEGRVRVFPELAVRGGRHGSLVDVVANEITDRATGRRANGPPQS